MFIFSFIFGVPFILLGVWILYMKYRVIVGGTRCMAQITRSYFAPGGKGMHAFMVAFEYKAKRLEKPLSFWIKFFQRKHIGKRFNIYYNEKYPKDVVSRRHVEAEIYAFFFIAMGILFFILPHR